MSYTLYPIPYTLYPILYTLYFFCYTFLMPEEQDNLIQPEEAAPADDAGNPVPPQPTDASDAGTPGVPEGTAPADEVPVPAAPPFVKAASYEAIPPPAREQPLILVTDDDSAFREVVVTKLKAVGFQVDEAKNGTEALAKAKAQRPDLVLLDILMPPGPTGTDVALEMKEIPETMLLKVMFLSGQDDPFPGLSGEKASVSHELGAEDYIMKTESLDVMVEKVKKALGIAAS